MARSRSVRADALWSAASDGLARKRRLEADRLQTILPRPLPHRPPQSPIGCGAENRRRFLFRHLTVPKHPYVFSESIADPAFSPRKWALTVVEHETKAIALYSFYGSGQNEGTGMYRRQLANAVSLETIRKRVYLKLFGFLCVCVAPTVFVFGDEAPKFDGIKHEMGRKSPDHR